MLNYQTNLSQFVWFTRHLRAILLSIFLFTLGLAISGQGFMTAKAAGVLRYATVGEPPSLDQQVITSDLSTTIAPAYF